MTASIQTKGDMYYIVLNWVETELEQGIPKKKRKQQWVKSDIPVSGNNKRKIEAKRSEVLREWEDKITGNDNGMLFADWLSQWLEETQGQIAESTYFEYRKQIENSIAPYFREKKIKLRDLETYHIQEFYNMRLHTVSANTVKHYHANIHKALSYAVKMGRLRKNPADNVELPEIKKRVADYYTTSELRQLLNNTSGSPIETIVYLAAWFGMRRGEIIGLRWSSVDLDRGVLSVTGVVKDKSKAGIKNRNLYYVPNPKTDSSIRSFPMSETAKKYLTELKAKQERWSKSPGYNHDWDDFVCVRKNGDLIPLEYVTRTFPQLCEKSGMRPIRLHELRHTNLSLLLENGATMKELQEWAGHSSYSTTANIYAHVQAKSKEKLTATLEGILG